MEVYRVVPMRLFATWEVDRASSNCVPRLCQMTLNRLTILKPLDSDVNCLVITVKLQGFKRTLRSNELIVTAVNGIIDVDLDISFTLQYPHFVKKKGNDLLILLQKKKKYKNRPIPGGFKTLATGVINLTDVLQSSVDRELCLFPEEGKEDTSFGSGGYVGQSGWLNNPPAGPPFAKLYLLTCSSQPLDQEESRKEKDNEPAYYSDEEADDDSSEGASDSEPLADEPTTTSKIKRFMNRPGKSGNLLLSGVQLRGSSHRQKNLKNKFMTLLKKFKISEEDEGDGRSEGTRQPTSQELQALFEELENLSDSGPEIEVDRKSLECYSTQKPGLQPFFNSATSSREVLPGIDTSAGGGLSEESKDSEASPLDFDEEGSDPNPGSPGQPEIASAQEMEATLRPFDEPRRPVVKHSQTTPFGVDIKNKPPRGKPINNRSMDEGGSVRPGRLNSQKDLMMSPRVVQEPLKHAPIAEQLTQRLSPEESGIIPDNLLIVSAIDVHCQALVNSLREHQPRVLLVSTQLDLKAVLSALLSRIQRFCNTSSQKPRGVPVTVIGGDRIISYCLKAYMDLFAQKPNEWQTYVRFILIPPVFSSLNRCLASLDSSFTRNQFCDNLWRDWWEKMDLSQADIAEISSRIHRYQRASKVTVALSIAEAMLQIRPEGKGLPEDNSQVFVPFIVDLRIGSMLNDPSCMDQGTPGSGPDVSPFTPVNASAPPTIRSENSIGPGQTQPIAAAGPSATSTPTPREMAGFSSALIQGSPPSSPHILTSQLSVSGPSFGEAQDLQVEYWPTQMQGLGGFSSVRSGEGGGSVVSGGSSTSGAGMIGRRDTVSSSKITLKTAFRSLSISRFFSSGGPPSDAPTPALKLQFVKERKKDKMLQKLGMKKDKKEDRDAETKSTTVECVSRMICSSKHSTMRVLIDGVEWNRVKFFQTTALWQTNVKQFPIAISQSD